MINFLRNIRRKLIEIGNLNKYLIFAVGEILFVMIGILLALQVNNWNEARKEAKTESIYLERLLSELKLDTLYFSNEIQGYKTNNQIIEDFSAAINNDNSQDSILLGLANEFFRIGWVMPTFSPSTSTFDDLSSTGNLRVITNTSLRGDIVNLYHHYRDVRDGFRVNHDWLTPIDALLTSQFSGLKYDNRTAFLYPSQSFSERMNELRKDREIYIRNASNHYWTNQSSSGKLTRLKGRSTELIHKLEIELTRHN